MIKRLAKINSLGIFSSYSWPKNLTEFKRYNLIYGWNGCGKTTLSHLFEIISGEIKSKYDNFYYEVELDNGIIKNPQISSRRIRVFNQDYVARNLKIIEGKASAIYILGEENTLLFEQIEEQEKELATKEAALQDNKIKLFKATEEKGKLFTQIASIISMGTGGNLSRTYRKPNAEASFNRLEKKEILTDKKIAENSLVLKQEQKSTIPVIEISKVKFSRQQVSLQRQIEFLISTAQKLLNETVEAIVLDRLRKNTDIGEWVESGLVIHQKHHSNICEFCQNPISNVRLAELTNHFNDADQKLKQFVDELLEDLRELYIFIDKQVNLIDASNLYNELNTSYQSASKEFSNKKTQILSEITLLAEEVKSKKLKSTETVELTKTINLNTFVVAIEAINTLISSHNKKTEEFNSQKQNATLKIETHYLSTIYDEVNQLDVEIKSLEKEMLLLNNTDIQESEYKSIPFLKESIKQNKAKVSSSHRACEEINEFMKTFLGRDELLFEVDCEEGYIITRKGTPASNLSEGEKTAITFIYFLIHLKDQNFNLKEGIVVIDDPISSLDSNSIFQAFALMKNCVKDAKQVFIFTHNFDFIRLIINWLNNTGKNDTRYLMIKNKFESQMRIADIEDLDKLLEKHESEYHYLFKRIYTFKSDGSIELVYDIPNIARKVLDTFLMFMVPNSESQYKKMEKIQFDDTKKTSIYKFANDQSHITGKGFDPSLVQETQKNVALLLEMIEHVFPEHYKILVSSC